ncbi:MAG: HAMP domain-containing sensor histidine kinase [Bacteroidia bacterium]|nr:HAMP domain-containing sensor histidine kinase [Bacteroidia bacterium]
MRGNRYRIFLIILTVVVVLMALAAESLFFSDFEYRFRTKMFNKTLSAKEKILEDCLNAMKPILAIKDHHGSVSENNLFTIAEQNKITILEYFDNKLVYWSDNGFSVPSVLNDSLYAKPLIFLQNGWFLPKTVQAGNEKIVGLLRLHTDYGFENDIIKSGFEKEFHIPGNVGFSTDKNASEFHVFDTAGDFLFSLSFPEVRENTFFILIPLCLWTCVFILLIFLSLELAKLLVNMGRNRLAVGFVLLVFSLIYILILITGRPSVLFQTELFSPYRFSFNNVIPSLGHLVLISILSACFSYFIYSHFPLQERPRGKRVKDYLFLTILMICGAFLFSCCNLIFSQLISNSNINFETYKVLELNVFSIIGFAAIILLMLVPVLFMLKAFQIVKQFRQKTIIFSIITSLFVPVVLFCNDSGTFIPFSVFYIVITTSLWISGIKRAGIFNLTVIFSLIFGIYSLYLIAILSEEKITENLKIQAVSFSTENDPEAEHLLLDLWPVLTNDSALAGMMKVDYFDKIDFDRISSYLQEKYFIGYWRNFYFNPPVLCRNDQSLRIDQGNEVFENCFSFFEDRIRRDGHQLTGTGFYFIDNQGGRSYYIGRLFFKTGKETSNGLFIELYNDVNVFQAGYSELLLDKKYHGYAGLKDYSFAKYINGKIVLRTGEFPYDETDAEYVGGNPDYKYFKTEGFKHILYKNGNATVLISRTELTAKDVIISFAYLFAFILLFFNLVLLIIRRPELKNSFNFNFRQKLQMSFIGVLMFSFLLIGGVIASFTIRQYQTKHTDNLKEKLNSIYLELEGKIAVEKHLSSDWSNSSYSSLNDLLIKFSNVFKTDINLYDLNGFLIATSRPEIFFRDLTSRRINNMAYNNLSHFTKSEFFQKEKIGSLEYISAYVPFFNTDNKVLAYLNLPYFRMQSVLAKEISNLIVAVINFTLLFIVITMSLAVFISGRLTSPLMMLGDGLASVGVGKKSEHLTYKGNDEIGELVKQYNRMVDEIEESTHKLANSEREYAWREMAKQIAHEIKNPLTPMKLNVQQLFKSWNDKVPGFEKKLERFTKNQIEYIDNLSSIASAFSSFAKMPGTNPMEVNLLDQIKITLELFKNAANITFRVHWPHESKVIIYADKEHLNGVFSNLIKNGIQSIPPGREGLIKVNLDVKSDKVVVSISDNGTGIPEDLQKKLFTPNFTTKSSGMGLGLSIVKKYIESANGRIWFESDADRGSVFFVELPLMYTVEKLG